MALTDVQLQCHAERLAWELPQDKTEALQLLKYATELVQWCEPTARSISALKRKIKATRARA